MTSNCTTLVETLGKALIERGLHVTTAESCTGGGIAQAITDIVGSSRWFEYGFVTYANVAKIKLLGVSEEVLIEHGAVSEVVVAQMAKGALDSANADIAVAVSGIAGPDGGTTEKPVGTVWFCWQHLNGESKTQRFQFSGSRSEVRQQAVVEGLKGLVELIS